MRKTKEKNWKTNARSDRGAMEIYHDGPVKSGLVTSFWLSPLSSTLESPDLLIYPYYII